MKVKIQHCWGTNWKTSKKFCALVNVDGNVFSAVITTRGFKCQSWSGFIDADFWEN